MENKYITDGSGEQERKAVGFKYIQLADELEKKIRSGSYRAGEKLPSLRKLRQQTGMSVSTIYQAYGELEMRGVVDVREKSGFYAKALLEKILPLPIKSKRKVTPHKIAINALSAMLQQSLSNPSMVPFGAAIPVPELLPCKQLATSFRSAAAQYGDGSYMGYGHPSGLPELRRQIGRRFMGFSASENDEEIIITRGCMDAIDLCLRTVAKAGDIILVESPTFLCYLQLIEDLNMRALEVPVDSERGLSVESVAATLEEHDVRAALLNPNFHNPLGCVMQEEDKRQLVELMGSRGIPIIEDDIYGELFFGSTRPVTLKAFDQRGLVLYCSSFSKTIAPDLRIGWTLPGRFREKVKRLKFNASISSSQLGQLAVADFLASGQFDRHLRVMRNKIQQQVTDTGLAVARYFPPGTRMSAPKGGLCLWIELDEQIDGLELFTRAEKQNISILPGTLCSGSDHYSHCFRMNCGTIWDAKIEGALKTLGEIVTELLAEDTPRVPAPGAASTGNAGGW